MAIITTIYAVLLMLVPLATVAEIKGQVHNHNKNFIGGMKNEH